MDLCKIDVSLYPVFTDIFQNLQMHEHRIFFIFKGIQSAIYQLLMVNVEVVSPDGFSTRKQRIVRSLSMEAVKEMQTGDG